MWRSIKESLFPPLCEICDQPAVGEGFLCKLCFEKILPLSSIHCEHCAKPFTSQETSIHRCGDCLQQKPAFEKVYSPFLMEGSIRQLLHQAKFGSQRSALKILAQFSAPHFTKTIKSLSPDFLLPVPLSTFRLLKRGFNQSALLTQLLLAKLGEELKVDFSIRRRYQKAQALKSRAERIQSLKQAFYFSGPGPDFNDAKILIIDDVLTTGATAEALTRLCLKARAKEVRVWVLARRM